MDYKLERFHKAQEDTYQDAFKELRNGRKRSHWMWFIFPQLAGLGYSEVARFYSIRNLREAELFLCDKILGERLIRISELLLEIEDRTAYEIFGSPDDLKLRSCMTLFSLVHGAHPVFLQVLERYFAGKPDEKTLQLIRGDSRVS